MKIWFYLVLSILLYKIVNGEKEEVINLESLHPLVLRTLLDLRGVSLLETVPESELINKLLASGLVTPSEIDALSESPISLSEKIEDYIVSEKDIFNGDVWVYKVLTKVQDRHDIYINNMIYLRSIFQPYGIGTGVFLCWKNEKFCKDNSWIFDRYVVQIPGEIPQNIYYTSDVSSTLKSIELKLNSKLNVMKDKESLDKWLQNPLTSLKVLLILPEHAQIPLFFSSLNANYLHHTSFGVVERSKARHLLDRLPNISQDSDRIGRYLVITPTKIYNYGENVNEIPNYKSMERVVLENCDRSKYRYVIHFTIALLVLVTVFVFKLSHTINLFKKIKSWFQNADESKISNGNVTTTTTASTSKRGTTPSQRGTVMENPNCSERIRIIRRIITENPNHSETNPSRRRTVTEIPNHSETNPSRRGTVTENPNHSEPIPSKRGTVTENSNHSETIQSRRGTVTEIPIHSETNPSRRRTAMVNPNHSEILRGLIIRQLIVRELNIRGLMACLDRSLNPFQRNAMQSDINQIRETILEMLNHFESNSNESSATNEEKTSGFNEIICVICQYEFSDGDHLKKLRCGHRFHQDCIQLWNSTGQHNCPLCRNVS